MTARHTLPVPSSGAQTPMRTPDVFAELVTIRRTGVGVLIMVAALAALAAGVLLSDGREVRALSQGNYELARRANKLRAESAVKEAQIMALSTLLADSPGKVEAVRRAGDRYALEHMGDGSDKTYEEVRRETCTVLAEAGTPCSR
jgi:hypothetical protein